MDTEELLIVVGILIAIAALLIPGQHLSGTFCEGQSGRLGDYYVSVANGYLRVSASTGNVFVAWKDHVIQKRAWIDYTYSNSTGCYTVEVSYKGPGYLLTFAGGLSLVGGVFFYMTFLKYR
ncbi:hypothetical protein [Thermococcus sp.]|uniref:hypothetical protein n=1 Tax=Thermococcus sp. TaxID=35749 RepID=UPI002611381F|nr:hypothetical protein [Thermococcus sp.]